MEHFTVLDVLEGRWPRPRDAARLNNGLKSFALWLRAMGHCPACRKELDLVEEYREGEGWIYMIPLRFHSCGGCGYRRMAPPYVPECEAA